MTTPPSTKKVNAGRLLSIECGKYSDYSVKGFFVALRDVDFTAELEAYLTRFPAQRKNHSADQSQFLAWLIGRGALLEIEYVPVHIGPYSTLEIT